MKESVPDQDRLLSGSCGVKKAILILEVIVFMLQDPAVRSRETTRDCSNFSTEEIFWTYLP